PLFQAATANVNPRAATKVEVDNEDRGPLLLTMGGMDHTGSQAMTKSTYKQYRKSKALTEIREFDDRGHSLTIYHGWRDIADSVLDWLRTQGLEDGSARGRLDLLHRAQPRRRAEALERPRRGLQQLGALVDAPLRQD